MPENKNFALRLEIIDECLRNNLRKWSLKVLLDVVNERLEERYGKKTSKRTLQNDIRHLIDDKNAPIEKRKEGSTTYFSYTDKQFSIKNLPLNEEEITQLKDVINILRQVNNFSIVDEVSAIVSKLENTINVHTEPEVPIIQFEKHEMTFGTQYINDLYEAIKGKTALKLSYRPFSKKPDQFICYPYLLKEYRNRWFMIGRREGMNVVTIFALDRIQQFTPSFVPFVDNNLFDPETYFNNLVGVTLPVGGLVQKIDLKVTPAQAPYIRTKPIHSSQKIIKEYKNGGLVIRLMLIPNFELRSLLLSYVPDITVLTPAGLVREIKELLKKAVNQYKHPH